MAAKEVFFGNDARVQMLEGVNILANAVNPDDKSSYFFA